MRRLIRTTILNNRDVIVTGRQQFMHRTSILWQRVMQNRHQPKIIVIDPRATETSMAATQHLAVYPKSDLMLLYGVGAAC